VFREVDEEPPEDGEEEAKKIYKEILEVLSSYIFTVYVHLHSLFRKSIDQSHVNFGLLYGQLFEYDKLFQIRDFEIFFDHVFKEIFCLFSLHTHK